MIKIASELLERKIASYMNGLKERPEIKCFLRAAELLATPCAFDLFFLDIQMPEQE